MPKPMYVWSGSAWVSVAAEVESLATYATQSYADNAANVAAGLKPIVPSSVAIGSGSSSISTLGTVTFTTASSVSLNGVFTSTYKNYRLVVNLTTSQTSSQVLGLKMRASSVDTSTGYYNLDIYSSSSAGPSRSYESNAARFTIGNTGNNRTI